jgi:hypothetical protein
MGPPTVKEFFPNDGIGITQNEFFARNTVEKIIDHNEAGIILHLKESRSPFYREYILPTLLSHEIGHVLLQTGEEHVEDSQNIMFSGMKRGQHVYPSQYSSILDYQNEKPITSIFIVEEEY